MDKSEKRVVSLVKRVLIPLTFTGSPPSGKARKEVYPSPCLYGEQMGLARRNVMKRLCFSGSKINERNDSAVLIN